MRRVIGQLALRHSAFIQRTRQLPLVGGWISRLGRRLLPPESRVWVQIQAGFGKGLWLNLNPRTGSHYLRGGGEQKMQEILVNRLGPGSVFYDVGANIGLFSLIAARQVGPNGHVIAFEPENSVATRLMENAERNGFRNVTVVRAAVWSSTGTVHFAPADPAQSPDYGVGRVVELQDAAGASPTVAALALDDCVGKFPPPDLIKCDVEGAEVEVFRGASRLLNVHKPDIICEVHSPDCREGVTARLSEAGYSLTFLDSTHLSAVAKPPGPIV